MDANTQPRTDVSKPGIADIQQSVLVQLKEDTAAASSLTAKDTRCSVSAPVPGISEATIKKCRAAVEEAFSSHRAKHVAAPKATTKKRKLSDMEDGDLPASETLVPPRKEPSKCKPDKTSKDVKEVKFDEDIMDDDDYDDGGDDCDDSRAGIELQPIKDEVSVRSTAPPPKKKKKPSTASQAPSATPRKQPGYAMIKAEDDRLKRALSDLVRKRDQRESSSGGRMPTSTCGVLNNNLIEFYEDTIATFTRKFGRYIN